MMKKKYETIITYLNELIPNPRCELDYSNDYTLLINIVLSAQTTDKRVNQVTKNLYKKYSSLKSLSEASIDDIKNIIKPLGNFNKKASYIKEIAYKLHNEYNDQVPLDDNQLLTLPGVGRKTVNVFLAEYKGIPRIAVDTHVLRVTKRLGLVKDTDGPIEVEETLCKNLEENIWAKSHLQLVLFGRYYCKAVNPECENCKLNKICKCFNK